MNNFISKIKNWYENSKTPKVDIEKKGIKPAKDWNVLLFIMFFIVAIVGSVAFYFFKKVESGTFFKVIEQEDLKEVKINNDLLSKIISDINLREKNMQEIKNGKSIPPNPSL